MTFIKSYAIAGSLERTYDMFSLVNPGIIKAEKHNKLLFSI